VSEEIRRLEQVNARLVADLNAYTENDDGPDGREAQLMSELNALRPYAEELEAENAAMRALAEALEEIRRLQAGLQALRTRCEVEDAIPLRVLRAQIDTLLGAQAAPEPGL
jgi:DNA repair exonuclease SbcCD ATPase subunit